MGSRVVRRDLRFKDSKRRPCLEVLIILVADQQLSSTMRNHCHVLSVALPHFFWQSYEGGTVIHGIYGAKCLSAKLEDVTRKDVEVVSLEMDHAVNAVPLILNSEFGKQLLDGFIVQFGTDHAMSSC